MQCLTQMVRKANVEPGTRSTGRSQRSVLLGDTPGILCIMVVKVLLQFGGCELRLCHWPSSRFGETSND